LEPFLAVENLLKDTDICSKLLLTISSTLRQEFSTRTVGRWSLIIIYSAPTYLQEDGEEKEIAQGFFSLAAGAGAFIPVTPPKLDRPFFNLSNITTLSPCLKERRRR
jgi:hypothetical protein